MKMKYFIFALFCLQIASYDVFASEAPVKKVSPAKMFITLVPIAYVTEMLIVDGIDALKSTPIKIDGNIIIKNLCSTKRLFNATRLSLGATFIYSTYNCMLDLKKIKLN